MFVLVSFFVGHHIKQQLEKENESLQRQLKSVQDQNNQLLAQLHQRSVPGDSLDPVVEDADSRATLLDDWTNEKAMEIFFDKASSIPTPTDKFNKHGYQQIYLKYAWPLRDRDIKIFEIGIGCPMGSYGYKVWLHMMSVAHVFNADLPNCVEKATAELAKDTAVHQNRTTLLAGSTDSQQDIERWAKTIESAHTVGEGPMIIIDDGAHTNFHQINALNFLWDTLQPGGFYIIEDVQLSRVWKVDDPAYKDEVYSIDTVGLLNLLNSHLTERELAVTGKVEGPRVTPFPNNLVPLNIVKRGLKSIECFQSACVLSKCLKSDYKGKCWF